MLTLRYLCALMIFTLSVNAQVTNWHSGGKLKPEQALTDIRHYTLRLNVDPSTKSITGSTEIDLVLTASSPVLIFDLVSYYKISTITVNGKKEPFTYKNDLINIKPSTALKAGNIKVVIDYSGQPPIAKRPPWDGGFQWSKDSIGNDWIAITS